ncbi:MAG: glutamine amidotransferase [Eubacterium sp.]|nr:glutamine amidotransferase [Eubacterium sp.]
MPKIVKICHLYPEVLNLYGDRGNILCLKRRLEWRGISCSISEVKIGDNVDFTDYDLFFIGGGQDFEQEVLLSDLKSGKGASIKAAVEDGKTFLCICGGYQMMGDYYLTKDGNKMEFLGVADFYTIGTEYRMIGNYTFMCDPESGGCEVVGFENHSGRTYLGSNVSPLGHLIYGYGNNGDDDTEGVRYKNLYGSYCHGPILPKNPEFADHLLKTTLNRKYGDDELSPLNDSAENDAHDYMFNLIIKGATSKD